MMDITIDIDPTNLEDYNKFVSCKKLPRYKVIGNTIYTDKQSYGMVFGGEKDTSLSINDERLFDYQNHFVNLALERKRYAMFADCGLGKMVSQLMWHKAIGEKIGKTLFLLPLSVMQEVYEDVKKFNIDIPITNLRENKTWNEGIGLLNFESLRDLDMTGVKGIGLDESSVLKNAEGKTKKWLVEISKKTPYLFCTSATPSPNEQSEYASHALFLRYVDSDKEFWARFFRKEGTKWILKQHAVKPFYKFLSTFACYIHNPKELGFEQGGYLENEPNYNIIDCKGGEEFLKGKFLSTTLSLSEASPIYKYRSRKETDRFVKSMEIATNGKQTITWCNRNAEEEAFSQELKDYGHVLITGKTKIEQRVEYINAFRAGEIKGIISKPKILGWGVNLQQADQHLLSGYDFSFESLYQAIRRSHRYGRKGVLDVYVPQIEAERPLWQATQNKLKTFKKDISILQELFRSDK